MSMSLRAIESAAANPSQPIDIPPTQEFSYAEEYGVIQLFNAVELPGKPNFWLHPHFWEYPLSQKAAERRQWLQRNSDQLDSVQKIDLSSKSLTVIPREISLFRNLQILNLSNQMFSNLEILDLSSQLNLPNLLKLNLSRNLSIRSLQGFSFNLLPKLQKLNLSENNIRSLQGVNLNLPDLQKFNLSKNSLRSLQGVNLNLPDLQKLNLSKNSLRSLRGANLNFPNLRSLSLQQNQITEIPDEVFHLPGNCEVDVSANRLTLDSVDQLQRAIERRRAENPQFVPPNFCASVAWPFSPSISLFAFRRGPAPTSDSAPSTVPMSPATQRLDTQLYAWDDES